jgi:HEAT repeat protein
LIPLIRDPETKVHEEAIVAVGRLKVTEAVPQLNELYSAGIEQRRKIFGIVPVSGTDYFQRKVLEALAQIGDPRSSDIFEDALNDERDHYRRYGAEGLGRIGNSDYQSLIARHYLREKSENVKLAMGYSLFLLGREEHIVELVDNISKDQVYYYLLELPPSKVAMLHSYVQTEGTSTKIRLLSVMGLVGDTSGMPIIQEMTQDENADIASAANLAIRRLQGRFPNG